ncbi:MAG: histidine kinase [Bacteroidetes bacterium]|nr:histidine kinase [Bacteroidota bacterium]MBS1649379.1 histidine kinase [Bacteroidota bacterium]
MRKKISTYWLCQLAGWLFYALTMVFFSYIFVKFNALFLKRIALFVILGFLFTHLLRVIIKKSKLVPPLSQNKFFTVFLIVLLTCISCSLLSSYLIQWLGLFDPAYKGTISQRFLLSLISDAPIIILWVCIYYIWHYIVSDRKRTIDNIRLESLVKELELKTIKSHINPHFIFNALNSIRALVDEDPQRARTAITELSNILRSSMQAEKLETVPFERELNIVKDYLALEHIRFEDRLNVEYTIDEETLDIHIPPMMLQTLVENAIKHGISKIKDGGFIKIIATLKENNFELIIENTGQLSNNANGDGFGIASTHNRLNILYGNNANFELKQLRDTTVQAKIIIPINNK